MDIAFPTIDLARVASGYWILGPRSADQRLLGGFILPGSGFSLASRAPNRNCRNLPQTAEACHTSRSGKPAAKGLFSISVPLRSKLSDQTITGFSATTVIAPRDVRMCAESCQHRRCEAGVEGHPCPQPSSAQNYKCKFDDGDQLQICPRQLDVI